MPILRLKGVGTSVGPLEIQTAVGFSRNGSAVTVTSSGTTIVTELINVIDGDILFVVGTVPMTKGAIAGRSWIQIQKNSGTGNVQFPSSNPAVRSGVPEQAANSQWFAFVSAVGVVDVSGDLTLEIRGLSSGSDGSVASFGAELGLFAIKG